MRISPSLQATCRISPALQATSSSLATRTRPSLIKAPLHLVPAASPRRNGALLLRPLPASLPHSPPPGPTWPSQKASSRRPRLRSAGERDGRLPWLMWAELGAGLATIPYIYIEGGLAGAAAVPTVSQKPPSAPRQSEQRRASCIRSWCGWSA